MSYNLQNDYTTPEQSKRLLELGVPEWTANYYNFKNDGIINKEAGILEICDIPLDLDNAIPCWSVGRLIEIIKICSKPKEQTIMSEELLYCRDLVGMLIFIIEGNRSVMDFSKLEE